MPCTVRMKFHTEKSIPTHNTTPPLYTLPVTCASTPALPQNSFLFSTVLPCHRHLTTRPKCRYEERTTPSPARALFLSFCPSFHFSPRRNSKFSQIPLQPLWLTYSLSESEPFFPYQCSISSTVLEYGTPELHPPTPVRQSHAQAAGTPSTRRCDRSNRGDAGRERENKDKKETFQSSLAQKHSLLESYNTVLGAISTELGGAGRGRRRRKRN